MIEQAVPADKVDWDARLYSHGKALVGLLMILGVLLMFANVVARHVFAAPFYWTEEVAVYLNIWCVFLGVALVTRNNCHLRMDLLLKAAPPRCTKLLNTASWLGTLLVSGVIVGASWMLLAQLWAADLRSVAVNLPMVIPHFAVFSGFLLTFVIALLKWRMFIEGRNEDLTDPVEGGSP